LEDIETSYWPNASTIYQQKFYGSGVLETYPGNAVKLFQDLVHIMNRKYYADTSNAIYENAYYIFTNEY